MILHGEVVELRQVLSAMYPEAPELPPMWAQMLPYQMLALYGLARQYGVKHGRILEVGTGSGASAYMLSKAAPPASIVTLTVQASEAAAARRDLGQLWCTNVTVLQRASADYLAESVREMWHMVFVDGDHNHIGHDLAWWNRLRGGGLFVCHDYSPVTSSHPSPVVYETLLRFGAWLGREPEVLVVDSERTGMAGWYRREGEVWTG